MAETMADLTAEREAMVERQLRRRGITEKRILNAFNEGVKQRPDTTFGTVNADVLAHFDDTYTREDFVNVILTNTWPE